MSKLNQKQQSSKISISERVHKVYRSWKWALSYGSSEEKSFWFHRLACTCEREGLKTLDVIEKL